MDTAERAGSEPVEQVYDGFISYSHAADDLLAPRLQAGLQRFAKPWWKRRALRVFRDESSLSANPHLWSSITDALDTSAWFVLLLSPDAAESEWVNQEVAYWVEHKDPSRIIPVLTAGEFGWDGDVTGNAVPDSLRGVLSEEPRWVDARGLGEPETLDLKNPEFAALVADLAAPLRGVPKDELAGEEVRQHKRTVRTAWAAAGLVVLLAVAASAAAVFALQQRDEAARQAEIADQQRELAEEQAQLADDRSVEAFERAQDAEALRLAALATGAEQSDAQLAMLLSLEGVASAANEEVRSEVGGVLRRAVTANRVVARIQVADSVPDPPTVSEAISAFGWFDHRAVLSPEGSTVFHVDRDENVLRARPIGAEPTWEYRPEKGGKLAYVSIHPLGDQLAVSVSSPSGGAGQLVVLDPRDGSELRRVASSGCPDLVPVSGGFSRDGEWFSVLDGTDGCVGDVRSPAADWATVYDTSTWEPVVQLAEPEARFERLHLADDRALLSYRREQLPEARLLTFPDFVPLGDPFEAPFPAVSPTGETVAFSNYLFSIVGDQTPKDTFGVNVRRADSGRGASALGWRFDPVAGPPMATGFDLEHVVESFWFSPDGTWLAVASRRPDLNSTGRDAVLDPLTGTVELVMPKLGDTFELSWSADGSRLLAVHDDALVIWDVEPDPSRLNEVVRSRDWVGFALETALVRGFSAAECAEFRITECPTSLQDVRSRYSGVDR